MSPRVGVIEALGLRPFAKAAREVRLALRGDRTTPRSRFDLSTLAQLRPRYGLLLWAGLRPEGRRVPVTNLFNYRQPPLELGWSVRVTSVEDFRGLRNTYDSHNGTDFAVPPGTEVVAAAPGRVLRISREFHRGGLKVFVDHGCGLVTTYNHLARALVEVGQCVRRGERIALSGYSGIDALFGFPWTPPHVHFNVWLNGRYVDPFARVGSGEVSLWRRANDPVPAVGADLEDACYEPPVWDEGALAHLVAQCRSPETVEEINAGRTLDERALTAMFHLCYFPTRFLRDALGGSFSLYRETFPRESRLDLPFSARDYDGVVFADP